MEVGAPSATPQNLLRKAPPVAAAETPGLRGVIPFKLLSGIVTYDKGQAAPLNAIAATLASVSNWKESGVVAEFCCHWIRQ